jgi:hypothetical protein
MLLLGVRSRTICRFTGVTLYRLSLWRRRLGLPDEARFRGPSHNSFVPFFRSPRIRIEGACLALLCELHDVVPFRTRDDTGIYCLSTGEALCHIFETYRALASNSALPFEQLVLLAKGLSSGQYIRRDCCRHCGAAILIDPLATPHTECGYCRTVARIAVNSPRHWVTHR